jgi:SAM-dependent methyltransferase
MPTGSAPSYKGIPIETGPVLHDQVAKALLARLPRGARLLDAGAGTGALSERLADLGFAVRAVDRDAARFRSSVTFRKLDLEDRVEMQTFLGESRGSFDAAIAVEVIEHVENPWQLVRDLLAAVRPGGLILITTPNLGSAFSRAWFFFRGRFAQFDVNDFAYGHIRPVSEMELRDMARRLDVTLEWVRPAGLLSRFLPDLAPRILLVNLLGVLASPLMRGTHRGYVLMALLRKPERPAAR